jgi:hypothetical protein
MQCELRLNTCVLCMQYTSFRGLVALGFGGVGSARVAGFNSTDAARYTALTSAYDTTEALRVTKSQQPASFLPSFCILCFFL